MAILGMKRFRTEEDGEVQSVDVAADLLMMLSRRTGGDVPRYTGRRLFRCKSCGRQFPSFQALGGHRASHKKPRLGVEAPQVAVPDKPRAHECPICGVEFAMGQALGGHMRRHRTGTGAFPLVFAEKKPGMAGEKRGVLSLDLDLNLPPSDKDGDFCSLKLGLGHPVVGFLY
ncbi:hypothetical protein Taro_019843 [Colocasia esculenta]|uniref:C2H2-type domain-containing protein n=1 Tax=Colocasia esculenta TaxID=4460 RepID=A0A843V3F6_COLES|nr:hypothetical protein [Colocasia esculenta]